jgi:hypothetical protein
MMTKFSDVQYYLKRVNIEADIGYLFSFTVDFLQLAHLTQVFKNIWIRNNGNYYFEIFIKYDLK